MSVLRSLAHPRAASGGSCSWCPAPAVSWQRSGRRGTDADGLVLACRACAACEPHASGWLDRVTLADVVRVTRPSRRADRAAQARRAAIVHRTGSRAAARAAADLRGASSMTHSASLMGAYRAMQADALEALADALGEVAS